MRAAEADNVTAAAKLVASALSSGGWVHAFGTGHGHMLAEELFYRAGGLARVNPILLPDLMLHEGAARSSQLEREPGRAEAILVAHPVAAGDVLVLASNSGGNPVIVELAALAQERGAKVIALTSLAHATSPAARAGGRRLHEFADVVLDNHGTPGDAALRLPGLTQPVAPTSTVIGAALLQAVAAQAAAILLEAGVVPEVWLSANAAGGDAANAELIARYGRDVPAL